MMTSRTRARLTWTLTVLVAALSVGREELHFVPGSGHVTRVGQLFVRFGLPHPKGPLYVAEEDGTTVDSTGRPFPIRDSSSCPICNDDFDTQMLTAAIGCESAPSPQEKVTGAQVLVLDCRFAHPFRSRAPPSA